MDFLYSLYDALVSINVPNDRARAVVDAMERDMATALATKRDQELLASKQDLQGLEQGFQDLGRQLESFRRELQSHRDETRLEFANVRREMAAGFATSQAETARQLAELQLKLTLRMGAMFAAVGGLTFAAIRLA